MTGTTDPLVIRHANGSTEGADPRKLGRAALEAAGYAKTPLLKAIRSKCLDCCVGQVGEVARCTSTRCPLWPYRMATDPFTNRKGGTLPPSKKSRALPSVFAGERQLADRLGGGQ
jgi:hypothetical protein